MKNFTDIDLLRELIKRNDLAEAPVKTMRQGLWHESLIAVGSDETVNICLTDEAYQMLMTGE